MRTGLTKQEKTTDIWFDEKDPLIHIRTHNTDLKKRLAAYAGQHPRPVPPDRHRPRNGLHGVCDPQGAVLFPSDRPIQRGTPQGGK